MKKRILALVMTIAMVFSTMGVLSAVSFAAGDEKETLTSYYLNDYAYSEPTAEVLTDPSAISEFAELPDMVSVWNDTAGYVKIMLPAEGYKSFSFTFSNGLYTATLDVATLGLTGIKVDAAYAPAEEGDAIALYLPLNMIAVNDDLTADVTADFVLDDGSSVEADIAIEFAFDGVEYRYALTKTANITSTLAQGATDKSYWSAQSWAASSTVAGNMTGFLAGADAPATYFYPEAGSDKYEYSWDMKITGMDAKTLAEAYPANVFTASGSSYNLLNGYYPRVQNPGNPNASMVYLSVMYPANAEAAAYAASGSHLFTTAQGASLVAQGADVNVANIYLVNIDYTGLEHGTDYVGFDAGDSGESYLTLITVNQVDLGWTAAAGRPTNANFTKVCLGVKTGEDFNLSYTFDHSNLTRATNTANINGQMIPAANIVVTNEDGDKVTDCTITYGISYVLDLNASGISLRSDWIGHNHIGSSAKLFNKNASDTMTLEIGDISNAAYFAAEYSGTAEDFLALTFDGDEDLKSYYVGEALFGMSVAEICEQNADTYVATEFATGIPNILSAWNEATGYVKFVLPANARQYALHFGNNTSATLNIGKDLVLTDMEVDAEYLPAYDDEAKTLVNLYVPLDKMVLNEKGQVDIVLEYVGADNKAKVVDIDLVFDFASTFAFDTSKTVAVDLKNYTMAAGAIESNRLSSNAGSKTTPGNLTGYIAGSDSPLSLGAAKEVTYAWDLKISGIDAKKFHTNFSGVDTDGWTATPFRGYVAINDIWWNHPEACVYIQGILPTTDAGAANLGKTNVAVDQKNGYRVNDADAHNFVLLIMNWDYSDLPVYGQQGSGYYGVDVTTNPKAGDDMKYLTLVSVNLRAIRNNPNTAFNDWNCQKICLGVKAGEEFKLSYTLHLDDLTPKSGSFNVNYSYGNYNNPKASVKVEKGDEVVLDAEKCILYGTHVALGNAGVSSDGFIGQTGRWHATNYGTTVSLVNKAGSTDMSLEIGDYSQAASVVTGCSLTIEDLAKLTGTAPAPEEIEKEEIPEVIENVIFVYPTEDGSFAEVSDLTVLPDVYANWNFVDGYLGLNIPVDGAKNVGFAFANGLEVSVDVAKKTIEGVVVADGYEPTVDADVLTVYIPLSAVAVRYGDAAKTIAEADILITLDKGETVVADDVVMLFVFDNTFGSYTNEIGFLAEVEAGITVLTKNSNFPITVENDAYSYFYDTEMVKPNYTFTYDLAISGLTEVEFDGEDIGEGTNGADKYDELSWWGVHTNKGVQCAGTTNFGKDTVLIEEVYALDQDGVLEAMGGKYLTTSNIIWLPIFNFKYSDNLVHGVDYVGAEAEPGESYLTLVLTSATATYKLDDKDFYTIINLGVKDGEEFTLSYNIDTTNLKRPYDDTNLAEDHWVRGYGHANALVPDAFVTVYDANGNVTCVAESEWGARGHVPTDRTTIKPNADTALAGARKAGTNYAVENVGTNDIALAINSVTYSIDAIVAPSITRLMDLSAGGNYVPPVEDEEEIAANALTLNYIQKGADGAQRFVATVGDYTKYQYAGFQIADAYGDLVEVTKTLDTYTSIIDGDAEVKAKNGVFFTSTFDAVAEAGTYYVRAYAVAADGSTVYGDTYRVTFYDYAVIDARNIGAIVPDLFR